ncbi:MAG: alpha/beta hydrolase domain-containing protein, partial [Acetobacteraceae bacterium]
DGTLTDPAQQDTGFPKIPSVTYNARLHTGDLLDFGPDEVRGITTQWPPILLGSPYPVAVSKVDADGNTVPGIRLPDIAVPIATYTGWNLRRNPPQEGCDHYGMYLPFAATKAERMANGDPRLSLAERYPDHASYVAAVTAAADALRDQHLLLDEDVDRYVQAAQARHVP